MLEKPIKTLRRFVYLQMTYPNVLESSPSTAASSSQSKQQRLPMTGTLDQIGADINQIKAMGLEHIVFGYAFPN
jgi:hypothetical protein